MIIVARFLQNVKDGILEITGYDAFCPVCGEPLHFHGRCRRFVRTQTWEQRIEMSIRVLYCMSCCRFHRELPDFLAPFKHFSLEMVSKIYDGIVKKPAVDGSTIIRLRYWVDWVLKYGAAILKRLKAEHPALVTKYNADSTLDTLRYFVMFTVNAHEYKLTSSHSLSG
jgi:hypothetical protein